ncbi:MFS transporter [Actinoplanes sp. NPDC051411]|uniref:MFS transporter n=1 Tax=Actinoplanes sp. NPDC051411 TaxID=3155522 RepID=UPI00343F8B94
MPPFRLFFAGRLISLLGSAMTPVALAFAVLDASRRPTDLGVVLAGQIVPQLMFLLVGGVAADRFPRRVVLLGSHLGAGVTQAAVATVIVTGHYHLALVAALAAGNGVAEAFASPALRGILPDLVPPESVQRANAMLAAARNACRIAGPTVSGLLVVTIGAGWSIALDAASFFVAAALLARLRVGSVVVGRVDSRGGFRDGWAVFRGLPWLAAGAISFGMLNLVNVGPWNILGPALTQARSGEAAWGVVLSVRAAGLLVMSALLYRLTFRHPLRAGSLFGVVAALPLLALGLGASLPVLLAAVFVGALGFTLTDITWETTLQTHVPREALSRVASIDDLISYAAIPLGQLLTGPFAALVGARRVALISGIGYAVSKLAPLSLRAVRDLGPAGAAGPAGAPGPVTKSESVSS